MALNTSTLVNAIASHAAALGVFDNVPQHEPKNAPGGDLTCAVWAADMVPVLSSGLASTSVRVVFNVRIYLPALNLSPWESDIIDPRIMDACDALLRDYVGNFTLGGLIREVDVRGADGNPLSAAAGYLTQDGKVYRVMTIFLPLVVNDLWDEAP
jgi:hypothetical protein